MQQTNCLRYKAAVVAALVLLAFLNFARAHDPGLSTMAIKLKTESIEAVATFPRRDIEGLAGSSSAPPLASEVLVVESAGRSIPCRDFRPEFDRQDNTVFHLTFATDGGALRLRSPLIARLPVGHRQFLSVTDGSGRTIVERLLRADGDSVELEQQIVSAAPTFAGFVVLGVEHILTGYDHLLFLFALLIVTRNFKAAVKIITCFTIAHSITLAAATLDLARFPATIVEPLIAATIVYVGVENLFALGAPASSRPGWQDAGAPRLRWRWLLTFAFGLIHGFGFASVLSELGVGANGGGIAAPLVSFNLGVELGQIAVAALLLPLIWKLQMKPVFVRRWVPACSAVVVLAGTCWFVQRVLGGNL